jgi:hypothetical protein
MLSDDPSQFAFLHSSFSRFANDIQNGLDRVFEGAINKIIINSNSFIKVVIKIE